MMFGWIISIVYIIYFWFVLILYNILQPLLIVSIVGGLAYPPSVILRKLQLLSNTIVYLLLGNEKPGKKYLQNRNKAKAEKVPPKQKPNEKPSSHSDGNKDTNTTQTNATTKSPEKMIIFIRHGESTWNDTFNKGTKRSTMQFLLYLLPNIAYALYMEWYFWMTGQCEESWFYDSPLSSTGIQQATVLYQFLQASQENATYMTPKEAKLLNIMNHIHKATDPDNDSDTMITSQLVSSNLRRAVSTMAIAFQGRLFNKNKDDAEQIIIVPSLQEISHNPDALCITPPYQPIVPSWTDPYAIRCKLYNTKAPILDTKSLHYGNKKLRTKNAGGAGIERIYEFCHLLYAHPKFAEKDCIIICGHSLWLKTLFQLFLPHDCTHISKSKKLCNCGVVSFTLKQQQVTKADKVQEKAQQQQQDDYDYTIDPTSIVVLHGGF